MRLAFASVLFASLLASPLSAYAWGDDGHRITGLIANEYLNEKTRVQLIALLDTDDLSTIATWMDDEREALNERLPGSSRWHYENRPTCAVNQPQQSCAKGQCVTQQIDRLTKIVHDRGEAKARRAEAIRMLVHLIGDVHQPLHMADHSDRGGNDVWVQLPTEREPRRLHELWDTRFVRMNIGRRGITRYADTLLRRATRTWGEGDLSSWAEESHQLAKHLAYGQLPGFACRVRLSSQTPVMISPAYIEAARTAIDEQLAKAGVRIAASLNAALNSEL